MGSMVAGPKDFIVRVKKYRKLLGGGMRQAGIIAAPGFSYNCMHQRLAILFCAVKFNIAMTCGLA